MRFTIYPIEDGRFVLIIYWSKEKVQWHAFLPKERMKMFAIIDKHLGPEPGAENESEEPPPPPSGSTN